MTVYFIECAGRIKIGYAKDVRGRLKGLSTGSAHDLNLLASLDGSVHFERAIHAVLKPYRLRGEWFSDCEAVRALMADLQRRGAEAISFDEPPEKPKVASAPKPDPFASPMVPVYRRVNACMDRYVGEGIIALRGQEQIAGAPVGTFINPRIGGFYTVERSGYAVSLFKHTCDCLSKIYDAVLDGCLDEQPFDQELFVPQGTYYAERLEQGLQRLFTNPDISIIDLSGYEGASLKAAA